MCDVRLSHNGSLIKPYTGCQHCSSQALKGCELAGNHLEGRVPCLGLSEKVEGGGIAMNPFREFGGLCPNLECAGGQFCKWCL